MCPLLSNGLYYQPLCCALRTLWSMAKRDVADLLPSWLGGPSGEVESPVAFVLVRGASDWMNAGVLIPLYRE